jgi:hypothetical protein
METDSRLHREFWMIDSAFGREAPDDQGQLTIGVIWIDVDRSVSRIQRRR